MQRASNNFVRAITATVLYTCATHAGWAEERSAAIIAQSSDTARRYRENVTPRARMKSAKKEAGAVYQAARSECRKTERAARMACLAEARATFDQTILDAKREGPAPHR